MRILLIGGSKSGKSRLAQELCRTLGGRLVYWATMEPADGEDLARIARHRQERAGWGFATVEQGRAPLEHPLAEGATVLFDSVTALLANEMFGKELDRTAVERVGDALLSLSRRCRHMVCVCDGVWFDGMAYDEATRDYARGLALICRRLAPEFDTVCEVTAGVARCRKGGLPR